MNDYVIEIANADYNAILIEVDSKIELKNKEQNAISVKAGVHAISALKTRMLQLKETCDPERLPTRKIGGISIKKATTVRYLGVDIDEDCV